MLRLSGAAEPAGTIWDMMDRQVNHMVRLVDDLMEVSRITRGKIELRKEALELGAMIAAAVETSRPLIEAARHELTVTLPPQPLVVEGDAVRLAQVFSNLLNNAVKYTDAGGRISIVARREEGERRGHSHATPASASPPTALPSVFDMFVQVDARDSRAQTRTGHRADARAQPASRCMAAASRRAAPGLARAASSSCACRCRRATRRRAGARGDCDPTGPRLAACPGRGRQPGRRRQPGRILQMLGAEVRVAHDGKAALEAFDCFSAGGGIPRPRHARHGRLRESRSKSARAPMRANTVLIALTGWGQEKDRRQTQAAGFNSHLVKPVDVSALQAVLASIAS